MPPHSAPPAPPRNLCHLLVGNLLAGRKNAAPNLRGKIRGGFVEVDGGRWQWDPDGLGCTWRAARDRIIGGLAEETNAAGVGTGLATGIVGAAGETRPGAAGIGAEGVEAGAEVPATAETPVPAEDTPTVPQNALDTLDHVDRTGTAPQGYQGGAPFLNDGRGGGQVLPAADAQGNPISYQEWDVNPRVPGVNRGAQRLVTGSDGSAYYTDDHYKTFTRIR